MPKPSRPGHEREEQLSRFFRRVCECDFDVQQIADRGRPPHPRTSEKFSSGKNEICCRGLILETYFSCTNFLLASDPHSAIVWSRDVCAVVRVGHFSLMRIGSGDGGWWWCFQKGGLTVQHNECPVPWLVLCVTKCGVPSRLSEYAIGTSGCTYAFAFGGGNPPRADGRVVHPVGCWVNRGGSEKCERCGARGGWLVQASDHNSHNLQQSPVAHQLLGLGRFSFVIFTAVDGGGRKRASIGRSGATCCLKALGQFLQEHGCGWRVGTTLTNMAQIRQGAV